MPALTIVDSLRLAINALRDVAESQRMPSGVELDEATTSLHADAAETLEAFLADIRDYE